MGKLQHTHGLYLLVQPLSEIHADLAALEKKLSSLLPSTPQNSIYLAKLCAPTQPPQVRMARLSALLCLVDLLSEVLPQALPCLSLDRDEHGRPFVQAFKDLPPFDFNLTHSKGVVGCVLLIGEGQVGLDIEDLLSWERAQKLSARFFSENEKHLLHNCADPHEFAITATRLWTAKEAISKQDGRGFPLSYDSLTLPPALRLWSGALTAERTVSLITVCTSSLSPLPILHSRSLPIQWIES